ncbi:TB2/DP1, HVA22 family-domain-containing protein [Xylaria sp. CBS 124048]|nr:TB2/DP1, HVA22 family-domain-containing protein [Xylaria sp. CBS 124048]
MFDIIAYFLASIASFLFPLFASYKALKTSDPAQLTPWLMYWSVLSCALLVEAWTQFILVWVPFYAWMRLGFLLWLVLPSTQGARVLYETYLHPYLQDNERAIEDFIARAHDRIKQEVVRYIKQAIEIIRTEVFKLPPTEKHEEPARAAGAPQGYVQSLLARFSVPGAQWNDKNPGNPGQDFYNLLAGAVSAAAGGMSTTPRTNNDGAFGNLIPDNIDAAQDRITFIATQREKLASMLGALDNAAAELQNNEQQRMRAPSSMSLDGQEPSRPPSGYSVGSALSGLSKSRSEVDFEKIDAPFGSEDEGSLHRRGHDEGDAGATKGGWNLFGWGAAPGEQAQGQSTGYQKE